MTSDLTGQHRGVGTGQAGSSQGPAPRAWDGMGGGHEWPMGQGHTLPPPSRVLCQTSGSVRMGSSALAPWAPLSLAGMRDTFFYRHQLCPPPASRGASWESWCQRGPCVPAPPPGSANRPPPPLSRPINGWVMSAEGAGEGRGCRCHRRWHRGC